MKTITIKLHENEAKELDKYVKDKNYPSKSEFIRNLIMEKLEKKEEIGWMILAEKAMEEIWDNKKDDEAWNQYL
jgi:Arc/MetJ-type ribon-helix-helix transcriptional regulator